MKILIVDDSNIVRRHIEMLLNEYNIEIAGTACNGNEALKLFKETGPDIITMDITMPEMDGLTCLEEILKLSPSTNILIISALKDKETGIKALQLGACGFLSKPFSQEQFREEMESIIQGKEL